MKYIFLHLCVGVFSASLIHLVNSFAAATQCCFYFFCSLFLFWVERYVSVFCDGIQLEPSLLNVKTTSFNQKYRNEKDKVGKCRGKCEIGKDRTRRSEKLLHVWTISFLLFFWQEDDTVEKWTELPLIHTSPQYKCNSTKFSFVHFLLHISLAPMSRCP